MEKDCPCLKQIKRCKDENTRKELISKAILCFQETPTICLRFMHYLRIEG